MKTLITSAWARLLCLVLGHRMVHLGTYYFPGVTVTASSCERCPHQTSLQDLRRANKHA